MRFVYSLKHTFNPKEQSVHKHIDIISILYKKIHFNIHTYIYIAELIIQTFIGLSLSTLTYLQYNNHQLIVILPNS